MSKKQACKLPWEDLCNLKPGTLIGSGRVAEPWDSRTHHHDPGTAGFRSLKAGEVIEDTDGSAYRVLRHYQTGRKLGSGDRDEGVEATALRGSLVQRGAIYHVPYVRIARKVKR